MSLFTEDNEKKIPKQNKIPKNTISVLFLGDLLSGKKCSFILTYFIPHYSTASDDNLFYASMFLLFSFYTAFVLWQFHKHSQRLGS